MAEIPKIKNRNEKYFENVNLKRSKQNFDETEKYNKSLIKYYNRAKEEIKIAILKEMSKKYYIEGQNNYSVARLNRLLKQINDILDSLYGKQDKKGLQGIQEDIFSFLNESYIENYNKTAFDLFKGLGVGYTFARINEDLISRTIRSKWIGDNFSDRLYTHKKRLISVLRQELSNQFILGKSYRETASIVSKKVDTSYKNAVRLVRTESTRIMNESSVESYKKLDLTEKYEYLATLDNRTSAICQQLDGKVFNVKDAQVGVNLPSMHPNCYDKETEVYTDKGWVKFSELDKTERMLSLNPETKEAEYIKPVKWFKHIHNGEMIKFSNRTFDLMVTPKHNMLLKYTGDGACDRFRFVKAENMPKGSNIIYRGLNWNGKKIEKVKLGDYEIDSKLFCSFMGFYLSEGSTTKIKNKNSYRCKIAQETYLNEFYEVLKELPFKIHLNKESINIYEKSVCKDLIKYGKCNEKYIPEIIKQMDKENINEFLKCFIMGDGSVEKGKFWKGSQFNDSYSMCTTSKRMADELGELILKVGGRPKFTLKPTKGKECTIKGRTYINNFDLWIIHWNTKLNTYVQNLKRERVQYNDFVYCVELPKYNTLLVRRNGFICWCGNCRSTTVPYFEDYADIGERITKNSKGKYFYVPESMNYAEYKKKYL